MFKPFTNVTNVLRVVFTKHISKGPSKRTYYNFVHYFFFLPAAGVAQVPH